MLQGVSRGILWTAGLVLVGSGCARRAEMIPRLLPAAEEVVARVRENGAGLRDFEGRASITIRSKRVKHSMNAVVLFKRPDTLKMEITGFMGMSLATMALQDGYFQIYLPMLNRVLEGPSDNGRLRSLTGVPFDLCDVKDILFGTRLLTAGQDSETRTLSVWEGQYVLSTKGGSHTSRVWVDPARLVVVKEEVLDPQGNLLMSSSYADYQEDDGVQIPRTIRVTRGEQEVCIRFTAFDINSGLAASRFQMGVPEDALHFSL